MLFCETVKWQLYDRMLLRFLRVFFFDKGSTLNNLIKEYQYGSIHSTGNSTFIEREKRLAYYRI
jgi:hypothetical protein